MLLIYSLGLQPWPRLLSPTRPASRWPTHAPPEHLAFDLSSDPAAVLLVDINSSGLDNVIGQADDASDLI
ncbi:hypothetical protein [Micromonospora sp. NPDC049171]|uniref:hypothetical protein n=1 Tax=Micromonospora sp. NPDC049171 TaxID=3155770 RepID=UPI0033C6CB9E